MAADREKASVRPTSLSPADLAKLLSHASGSAIRAEQIEADIAAGAPTNPDGTIHLVHYTAWLVREVGLAERERNVSS